MVILWLSYECYHVTGHSPPVLLLLKTWFTRARHGGETLFVCVKCGDWRVARIKCFIPMFCVILEQSIQIFVGIKKCTASLHKMINICHKLLRLFFIFTLNCPSSEAGNYVFSLLIFSGYWRVCITMNNHNSSNIWTKDKEEIYMTNVTESCIFRSCMSFMVGGALGRYSNNRDAVAIAMQCLYDTRIY